MHSQYRLGLLRILEVNRALSYYFYKPTIYPEYGVERLNARLLPRLLDKEASLQAEVYAEVQTEG